MTIALIKKHCDIITLEKQSKGNCRKNIKAKCLPAIKINEHIINSILFRLKKHQKQQLQEFKMDGLGDWNLS